MVDHDFERDPALLGIVEVAADAQAVPVVAEVAALDRDADRLGPEGTQALAAPTADARIDEAVAARGPQLPAERAAGRIVLRIEAGLPAGIAAAQVVPARVAAQIMKAGIDPAAECAHVLGVRRICSLSVEPAEVKDGLGDRGLKLAGGVVDPIAAIAEARAPGVQMGEGRHHPARPRPAHPLAGRDEADLADLVAPARIGQALDLGQRLPFAGVVGQALEQLNRREAGRQDAVRGRPADPPLRRLFDHVQARPGLRSRRRGRHRDGRARPRDR